MIDYIDYTLWSVECGGPGLKLPAPGTIAINRFGNRNNDLTPCEAYQQIVETYSAPGYVIIYAHDDMTIHDQDWFVRIVSQFRRFPDCVAVGFGGATSLGHPFLYRRPYRLNDMARGGYRSNQTDWQVHGLHEPGECRVAVLDAFLMAVRRDFLVQVGGWPTTHLTHHGLDLWVACEAARAKKQIRMVGVDCTHHGGGSSTKPAYREAKWLQGNSLESDHQLPHRWLYDNYRDVLPIEVQP